MKTSHSLDEFQEEARRFAASLQSLLDRARIVTLSGELGAGKTTFTKEVAAVFGIEEDVMSPTFVIEKIYEIVSASPKAFARLIHIDAYRLKEERELEVLGWHDIVADPKNLILLEWPEHVPNLVPNEAIQIRLKILDENSREIEYGKN